MSLEDLHRGHQVERVSLAAEVKQDFLADVLVAKLRSDRAADHAQGTISTEVLDSPPSFLKAFTNTFSEWPILL